MNETESSPSNVETTLRYFGRRHKSLEKPKSLTRHTLKTLRRMDSVQQPSIGSPNRLDELSDLDPDNLDWSESKDDDRPALVSTRQFLGTLLSLPELEALGPTPSDGPNSHASGAVWNSYMRTSPEQLIGVVRGKLIPISLIMVGPCPPLIRGAHSRYFPYLHALVTLITGSGGFLSLIRHLYAMRAARNLLPQKRKLGQSGLDEREPNTSETALSFAELYAGVYHLYSNLHHILRITLFEYQLVCDIEFLVEHISGLLSDRVQQHTLQMIRKFGNDHIYAIYHGCRRIKDRDIEVQEQQQQERLQSMPPPIYSPLIVNYEKQEIRLLELLSCQTTDDIRCHIVKTELKTSCHFQALSYVWGTEKPSEAIRIDGSFFLVTRTLERILRGLRHPSDHQRIWVDAICINQHDNLEKTSQVNLMGSIYKTAEVITIWLSGKRVDSMATPVTRCQDAVGCNENDFASLVNKMELALDQQDISKESWWNTFYHFNRCFYSVFIDEWWERLWTVQEARLSSKPPMALFRGYTFSWDTIERAIKLDNRCIDIIRKSSHDRPQDKYPSEEFMVPMLTEFRKLSNNRRGTAEGKLALRWRASPPSFKPGRGALEPNSPDRESLSYLISHSTGQNSKDPRDKMFALKGLLPKHLELLLYSDYNESFYGTFYRATGYSLCETTGMNLYSRFDTFHGTNPSQEVCDSVPSWALDFLSGLSSPRSRLEHQIGEEETFANYLVDANLGLCPDSFRQLAGVTTLLTLVCQWKVPRHWPPRSEKWKDSYSNPSPTGTI
ncbi:heterokaryon incompatibility protein-domain-containing protein [Xylaria digitata]|nr:heterokaryon incompatibility protein-domain-containing protein [Xylaria digitata]